MKRRISRPRLAVAVAAVVLLGSACTPGPDEDPGDTSVPEDQDQQQEEEDEEEGPEVLISPASGDTDVQPNRPVRVETADGTLTEVRVEQETPDEVASGNGEEAAGGAEGDLFEVTGDLNEAEDEWASDRNLRPGVTVTVVATAADADGQETEAVSEFTTLDSVEGQRLELASNFPSSGQTVGVGMPVIVNFDLPVTNKAQVENSIEVTAEEATEGAWNWVDDQMAVFRPKEYWEPYQEVAVDLRLAGVESADGVYGVDNHRIEFDVGRELISTMHVPDHEMSVEVDGETVRTIPVSNGAAEEHFDTTTSGIHLTMEKYESIVMDSATVGIPEDSPDAYRLDVDWAVRTSNSGEFTHAAPWNEDNLGRSDTSNGCTNMTVEDARWFHDESLMGDILETTGTDRELEWNNGWGFYQRSWEEWLSHSATGEPQSTDGSGTPGPVHGEGF